MGVDMKWWYEQAIEEEIRDVVRQLRNNGINTFCSCGHGRWIQCEFYSNNELDVVYNTLVSIGIETYKVNVWDRVEKGCRKTFMEISLPDGNGNYYNIVTDNKDYIQGNGNW